MAGHGPRATIVLPKGVQFQIEGVGIKFPADVEAECAASNLAALEALVAKAGGRLANKASQVAAGEAASAVEAKLDQYQAATNQSIANIGNVLGTILERLPQPATAPVDPAPAADAATPPKKK